MAVLQFKFDESYNERIMCVGGWIGNELEWKRLESRWQKRIDFENAHHQSNQQITRFHASHLNARDQEFKNWTQEMSISFSKKLIGLAAKRSMGAVCIVADMDALKEVFPEGDPNRQHSTYALCIKQMMVEIGHIIREFFPGDQVLLIHDHGNWDAEALDGYNKMVNDANWEPRNLFVGLSPMTGKQSVGLQVADLIAYEIFRMAKAKEALSTDGMRGAMREIIKKEIPLAAKYMNLQAVKALRKIMADSGKYGIDE